MCFRGVPLLAGTSKLEASDSRLAGQAASSSLCARKSICVRICIAGRQVFFLPVDGKNAKLA